MFPIWLSRIVSFIMWYFALVLDSQVVYMFVLSVAEIALK